MAEIQEIRQTERTINVMAQAWNYCRSFRQEFLQPEHLLIALTNEYNFIKALEPYASPDDLRETVTNHLLKSEHVPEGMTYTSTMSVQMTEVFTKACQSVVYSSASALDIPHLVSNMMTLEDSWANYYLKELLNGEESKFIRHLIDNCDLDDWLDGNVDEEQFPHEENWRRLVVCMNEHYQEHNLLIGRESELERTIQVLCRRDKNNPLHIGEPGVGKTALVWGLARLISEGRVPERLASSRIYKLDIGTLLAGTQYRGDFENRIQTIMDGILAESGTNIVYIDEIHTLVGAGAIGDSSMDASNMLKPYLESGNVRFIGSTTHEEYNRYLSKSKGMVRRFQQIEISEPSPEETKHILRQLRLAYEMFHEVIYDDEALDYAVDASYKYVNDRYLPDKAIDLIDEAGAAVELSKSNKKGRVTKKEISEVLSKTCKVEALAMSNDEDHSHLETLPIRILSKIYGQDEAVRQVVEAVQLSKAGLTDDNKPLASLLFVGPTGVGKTEVARVLAKELGIELLRFDMSEYAEKHTVAKLIGSPAGYVGYEDGGLLTDAIRKTPNCVLLLDEIEKAHQDIYNILLQVTDYARLTDNKGRKADFRNVIVIMTSNAGAQFASQASVGFSGGISRGEAMLKQVKKTFKPEFLNRLSGIVVFRDMNKEMATLILKKKIGELQEKLDSKQVEMILTDDAFAYLLKSGYTRENGAREMDRVIAQQLKPLLMKEILFGNLKKGGKAKVELQDGCLQIR